MDTLEDIVKRFQKEMTERYNSCVGSYNRSTIGNEGSGSYENFCQMQKCGIQMKLNTKCDKWRCNKKSCNTQLTTRYESLFNNSNLTYEEIMFLLYEILNNMPGNNIKQEYNFDDHTLKMSSTQIGGPGKVIEIEESKFGKQKYYKGRYVQGQWVFGGVERGTGLCFLVQIEDRTEQTLLKEDKSPLLFPPHSTLEAGPWMGEVKPDQATRPDELCLSYNVLSASSNPAKIQKIQKIDPARTILASGTNFTAKQYEKLLLSRKSGHHRKPPLCPRQRNTSAVGFRPARERCLTISEIGFTECTSCVIARARVWPALARARPGDRSPVGTSARFNHSTRSSMLQYYVVQHW
ncbi:hypothetical protein ANN_17961 [Periplaneta americana]|uniref:Uncharacterized protein n=1 Tax=Periplaneta americana TaxID=6978 RepID=A0ABQ8SMZ2_PERAM|nr:hypothetical protein ANN_17961 [Periplaneta americana]